MAEHRHAAGLTMDALSTRSGVSRPTIWRIEQGRVLPLGTTLTALAAALDLDVADLVAEEASP